jgi:hypothetical protein
VRGAILLGMMGGFLFFRYLQTDRSDLLDFRGGGNKWQIVHGWLRDRLKDRVELRGFGVFSAKLRGARRGRNPRTGVVVVVAKKAVPYFKTGKEIRARLNRETVPSA